MKKTVLAAPLLSGPGATQPGQRRQAGLAPVGQCAGRQYLSYRLHLRVAGATPSHPQYGTSGSRTACYNNVAGPGVTSSLASATLPGTYATLFGHNNQCNYFVEGGILDGSNKVVTAAAQSGSSSIRFTAQAATPCPDSESIRSFNAPAFCFASLLLANTTRSSEPCVRIPGYQAATD